MCAYYDFAFEYKDTHASVNTPPMSCKTLNHSIFDNIIHQLNGDSSGKYYI